MLPNAPYPGCSWALTQHMGVVTPKLLHAILWAAATYRDTPDPAARINDYIVANGLLPPNVRQDSGQPDIWRDYQQILSELGLIFSTEVVPQITPTPLGLAFLDGSISFSELMTLQAFRYQYPNGHKNQISPSQRRELEGTPYAIARSLARLQAAVGMQLRPAVLIWRVLRRLQELGEMPRITPFEIHSCLMRCRTHQDTESCVQTLIAARRGRLRLPPGNDRQERNARDWIRFLLNSPIFKGKGWGSAPYLGFSDYGLQHAGEIDELCTRLERTDSFWIPPPGRLSDKIGRAHV